MEGLNRMYWRAFWQIIIARNAQNHSQFTDTKKRPRQEALFRVVLKAKKLMQQPIQPILL
jgi:hypothetical protein